MTWARRIAVPDDVRRLELLDRVDDEDAFAASVPPEILADVTPERLAELVMAHAPRWLMHSLVPLVHRQALRLQLDPAAPTWGPQGWQPLARFPRALVLGAHGPLITFRLVVVTASDELVIATVTRYEHAAARPVWAVVRWGHRAVIRYLVHVGARVALPRSVD